MANNQLEQLQRLRDDLKGDIENNNHNEARLKVARFFNDPAADYFEALCDKCERLGYTPLEDDEERNNQTAKMLKRLKAIHGPYIVENFIVL